MLLWGSTAIPVLGGELIHRDWKILCKRKFMLKEEDFMTVSDLKGQLSLVCYFHFLISCYSTQNTCDEFVTR